MTLNPRKDKLARIPKSLWELAEDLKYRKRLSSTYKALEMLVQEKKIMFPQPKLKNVKRKRKKPKFEW